MTYLELVNRVVSTTGVGRVVDTLDGVQDDSDMALIKGFVRDAQLDVSRAVPNAPLQYHGTISTVEETSVEGVAVTEGNATVATTTATDSSWIGRIFHVTRDSEVYRVRTVPTGFTFTLGDLAGNEITYRGETASGLVGKIAQDRYLLPTGFKRPITLTDFFGAGKVQYKSPEDYDLIKFDRNGGTYNTGVPIRFTIYSKKMEEGDPRYYVEFDPVPDKVRRYPFRYEGVVTQMEVDSDHSGYLAEYEMALLFRARYYVYRYIKMDMNQAQFELAEFERVVGQQQKRDISGNGAVYLNPYTAREHYETAYDG